MENKYESDLKFAKHDRLHRKCKETFEIDVFLASVKKTCRISQFRQRVLKGVSNIFSRYKIGFHGRHLMVWLHLKKVTIWKQIYIFLNILLQTTKNVQTVTYTLFPSKWKEAILLPNVNLLI